MKLYFARHGQSEANLLHEFSNRGIKHPLTALGIAQARALADRLKEIEYRLSTADEAPGRGITAIYTSPLLRAVQTAEILSANLGVPFQAVDALREFDTGEYEGRSDAASWQRYDELMDGWLRSNRWDSRLPGGESFDDLRRRFVPFIKNLVEAPADNGNLLLVGHGGLYRCMLPLVLNNLDFEFTHTHHLGNAETVIAARCPDGLTCLRWDGLELEKEDYVR